MGLFFLLFHLINSYFHVLNHRQYIANLMICNFYDYWSYRMLKIKIEIQKPS